MSDLEARPMASWLAGTLLLALALAGSSARAAGPTAGQPPYLLWAAADGASQAPVGAGGLGPTRLGAAPTALDLAGQQAAAGAFSAALATPAALAVASWLGGQSANLYLAALPSLLVLAVVPPAAVTAAASWRSEQLAPGSAPLAPALWAVGGVHLALVASAILLGADSRSLGDVLLFMASEAVLLPAAAALAWSLSGPADPTVDGQKPAAPAGLPGPAGPAEGAPVAGAGGGAQPQGGPHLAMRVLGLDLPGARELRPAGAPPVGAALVIPLAQWHW